MSYRNLPMVVLMVVCILPFQVSLAAAGSETMPANWSLASGSNHTCALTRSGRVQCWGDNGLGQLGNGKTIQSSLPVDVTGLAGGVLAITAGRNHTCALTSRRGVRCWGDNNFHQLGDGTQVNSLVPVDVPSLSSGVSAVSAGASHSCALTNAGGVKCWGITTDSGTHTGSGLPADIWGLTAGVTGIASGSDRTCALTGSAASCFSLNSMTSIEIPHRRDPIAVPGLTAGVTAIATGSNHGCALTSGGGVWCWGSNSSGQLGNGATTSSTSPVAVVGLASGVESIVAGYGHTCALTAGGGVKCWGSNDGGLGDESSTTESSVPIDVLGLATGVSAISTGANHTCVRTSGGRVRCWGANFYGQLGNGTTTGSSTAVDVDFAFGDQPQTDMADPGVRPQPEGFPLLPLLAGLIAGIAMLFRRSPRELP